MTIAILEAKGMLVVSFVFIGCWAYKTQWKPDSGDEQSKDRIGKSEIWQAQIYSFQPASRIVYMNKYR